MRMAGKIDERVRKIGHHSVHQQPCLQFERLPVVVAGEHDDVALPGRFSDPRCDSTDLIGADMSYATGAASPDRVPGADERTRLVRVQRDDE